MSDTYKKLAKKFDQMPPGFPSTDDGIEIKILEKIYPPDEAEMALNLTQLPETAEAVAERLQKPIEEIRAILDDMANKGQIGKGKMEGQSFYMLLPFVPGTFELQMYAGPDKEFVELYESYFPTLMKEVGRYSPAITRIVPVQKNIESKTEVQRHEDVRKITEQAKSFLVQECACRKERAIGGHPCKHPLETCLVFANEENAFDEYPFLGGRIISKQEALDILDRSEEQGLVHNALYNAKEGHVAICNCCPCCCGFLRAAKEIGAAHLTARSDFVASIDTETCISCGECADERCPVDAIKTKNDEYAVNSDDCIGCGVCTAICPPESIKLTNRPEGDHAELPEDIVDWAVRRSKNRGLSL